MRLPLLISFCIAQLFSLAWADTHGPGKPARNATYAASATFDYDRALAASQAALGNQVSNHSFTSAAGSPVELYQLQGKPLIVSMVYTSCYQVCPMTTRQLAKVVKKAQKALGSDSFSVAVIGFDTPADSPATMRHFANQQGISENGWQLLTIDRTSLTAFAEEIGFQYFPSSNGFDHIIQATILDAESRVYRQVYGQVIETPQMVDPLIELVLGRTPPKQSLLADLGNKIKLFCTTYDPVRDGYFFDYSLFLGIFIGGSIILFGGVVVIRGIRKT